MHEHTRAAIAAGRARWLERMKAAKERGEIEKIPGGRRAKDLPPLSKDPKIRRAQRIVEKRMAEQSKAVARTDGNVPSSWDQLSKADKLARATDLGLDVSMKILTDGGRMLDELGLQGMDPKLLAEVRGTALSIIGDQIRIDAAALQASAIRHGAAAVELEEERRLLDTAFAGLGVRGAAVPRAAVIDVQANGDDVSAVDGEDM